MRTRFEAMEACAIAGISRREPSMHAPREARRCRTANELDDKIILDFARDIASRFGEAAIIARTADAFGKQGLAERAFQSLLDLEPQLHDAKTLLIATSVVRRREPLPIPADPG